MNIEAILADGFTPIDEGGYCKRIYTSPFGTERPMTTAIEYILPANGMSALHTLDADEMWIHLGGGILDLVYSCGDDSKRRTLKSGEHCIFPAGCLFGAREVADEDVHVICVVSPGYTDEGFRLVSETETKQACPKGWELLLPFCKQK